MLERIEVPTQLTMVLQIASGKLSVVKSQEATSFVGYSTRIYGLPSRLRQTLAAYYRRVPFAQAAPWCTR